MKGGTTMTRRWRQVQGDAQRDSGVTLIEMLVVVGILSLVLAMAMGMLIAITKLTGQSGGRIDQSQQGKVATESMTKTLRTAVLPKLLACSSCDDAAFISGNVRTVQFYGNLNNDDTIVLSPTAWTNRGPSKISYTVASNGELTEVIRRPDYHQARNTEYTYTCTAGSANCQVSSRVVARGVSTTQPLFTYYDRNGAELSPPLAGDQLASVDSVDITLSVSTYGSIPATDVVTRVTLPNAGVVNENTATPSP